MTLELQTESRDKSADLATLRSTGKVPAVYYGAGKDTVAITIDEQDFRKLYRTVGESSIFTLKTEAGDVDALIQDYQLHPVSEKVLHVDFKLVEAGVLLEVEVPIIFMGESPVEKTGVGTVTKVIQELPIEALPKDLPHDLTVDISVLQTIQDQILAKDIKLPAGVTLMIDPDTAIAVVSALREEVEETTEIDLSAIEATSEKKASKEEDSE